EKRIDSIAKAAFIFLLSGAFGFVILSSSNLALHEPLFAVFIGMFSFSNLIMTAKNIKIPKQRPAEPMSISQFLPIILVGVLLGSVADIFPAIGSSAQMATFGSILTGADPGKFLSLTMSVGVSHIFSSMISLQTIDKARAGWIAIIRENDALPNINILFLYFAVAVTSIAVAILIMLFLSKYFVIFLASINLKILNIIILLYLLAAILITCGISGLFISIVATAIGILPITLGVRRTHTMGFLLVPTLILLW
ncbi:MAG: tripartite tricarboxylate transporter permease, partial [Candidatus Micrarchaeia archaeon]